MRCSYSAFILQNLPAHQCFLWQLSHCHAPEDCTSTVTSEADTLLRPRDCHSSPSKTRPYSFASVFFFWLNNLKTSIILVYIGSLCYVFHAPLLECPTTDFIDTAEFIDTIESWQAKNRQKQKQNSRQKSNMIIH